MGAKRLTERGETSSQGAKSLPWGAKRLNRGAKRLNKRRNVSHRERNAFRGCETSHMGAKRLKLGEVVTATGAKRLEDEWGGAKRLGGGETSMVQTVAIATVKGPVTLNMT